MLAEPGEQADWVVGDDGVYFGVGHFLPLLGGVGSPGGYLCAGLVGGGDLFWRDQLPCGAYDLGAGFLLNGGEVLGGIGVAHEGVVLGLADEG